MNIVCSAATPWLGETKTNITFPALIKGFAAKVSEATLTKISEMAESYIPYIEDDYVVHIDGSANTGNQ